jgi:hypothetical protein
MTMRENMETFMKTLCTISATMASISFLGISIILTKFYPTTNAVWKWLGIYGAISVIMFAVASFFSLMSLHPKSKDNDRNLTNAIWTFIVGWAFFFVLILVLLGAFLI